ncbi:hypothetical protein DK254_25720 [Pseudomonas sp. RW407]|uniref:oligosaccharide flippase family protein n=1 Tax=Pseudomonas sp. RW407 TaxID=2202894 RepID=UPI000D70027F|nr:oligosaccharide flippase family protein [Pseudomonas sp. RW407]PWU26014.1 hypothetical protein DK254_25720 [Pseudomonas sp. RW407]
MSIKKVASNAGALLAIQFANYLLPFVLAPYLTRVLDTESYGVSALGSSIIQIAGIFIDYGFSISATYLIAKAKEKKQIEKIIGAVYCCKIILLIPVLALVFLYPIIMENYEKHTSFFWLLSLSITGLALQPVWLFQGLEKMKAITIYTVFCRLSLVILTIFLVNSPDDLYLFALANGISQLTAAAIGIFLIHKIGYTPRWTGWRYTISILRDSTEFFWSRAAVGTYGAGATFFLGATSSPIQVAYYAVAEQLFRGAIAIYSPITQALFPHMAKHRDLNTFKKVFLLSMSTALLGITIGILAGKPIIEFIYGPEYIAAYHILFVFMITLCATIPSIFIGYPLLGAFGNTKAANYSVIYAGLVQLAALTLCLALGKTTAFSVVCTVFTAELSALLYRSFSVRKTINKSQLSRA